jgi:hypothetical protein
MEEGSFLITKIYLIVYFCFIKASMIQEMNLKKDIWDVRNIPGARFPDHESRHILNFEDIPIPFRPLAKKIFKI